MIKLIIENTYLYLNNNERFFLKDVDAIYEKSYYKNSISKDFKSRIKVGTKEYDFIKELVRNQLIRSMNNIDFDEEEELTLIQLRLAKDDERLYRIIAGKNVFNLEEYLTGYLRYFLSLPEETKKYVLTYPKAIKLERAINERKLYNSSINLSNLISNILKLNKLENSEIELNDVNLSNVLENVIISYDELINNKKINLDIDMDDRLIKYTNESFIQLIFSNLISNAIKFSKYEGIVEIKLKNKNDYIEFMVKDNGIGMSKDTIIHIFNRFYQGDTSHKTEGNGLGLSMVKKAIDRLGYKISIESEEEKGSTFVVDIR